MSTSLRSAVLARTRNVMMLCMVLPSCTMTSQPNQPPDFSWDFGNFAKDKEACAQASHGSSPYASTTGGAANDQWTACMKDRGWQNVTGYPNK